jgi:hypothetical protein
LRTKDSKWTAGKEASGGEWLRALTTKVHEGKLGLSLATLSALAAPGTRNGLHFQTEIKIPPLAKGARRVGHPRGFFYMSCHDIIAKDYRGTIQSAA